MARYNVFTGTLDYTKSLESSLSFKDSNGNVWTLVVDTDGRLVTAQATPAVGSPMGPWLWLTYAS